MPLALLLGCQATLSSVRSPEEAARLSKEIAVSILERLARLIDRRDLPYRVTQAEFQTLPGQQLGWIMTFAGASENVFPRGFADSERKTGPVLRLYRDAVAPDLGRMDGVAKFLLAFHDPEGIIIEIEPEELRRYVNGDLSDHEMLGAVTIIRRVPGGSPAPGEPSVGPAS